MHLGYARVSTVDQDLAIQIAALKSAGCERIFQEKVTGALRARPELERMLAQLRDGDTVIVSKLDRLARSTRDLLEIAELIGRAGAGLRSLGEQWADTTTAGGRMILTVFAGIAEFERELIKERTGAGRLAAKARGVRFGKPHKLSKEQVALAKRLLMEEHTAAQVGQMLGVDRSTIYRAIAKEDDDGQLDEDCA